MPQSSAIFAFIAFAFLVFITQRGELQTYMGFFYGTTGSTNPASPTSWFGGVAASTLSSLLGGGSPSSTTSTGINPLSTAAPTVSFGWPTWLGGSGPPAVPSVGQ